ncbi:hypothetical protein GS4_20_01400 [Gordonia soli NBRC 108243]|uniref:Strictosidine synthase conserved region domain-containing protein n=2 Tax=Gordonia soli TaxID=320799 RepID=M0QKA6_9ACTN|nr:hypothetical protein GS4_20_01400 [Gordonia soli NBRC 108243]
MPAVRRVEVGRHGPEDVIWSDDGRVLTGTDDGAILAVDPHTSDVEVLTSTGGRPLGLDRGPDGWLYICDHDRGVLRWRAGLSEPELLVGEVGGRRVHFASNVAVAQDGSFVFSTSTQRYGLDDWLGDIMEHSGTGRLLRCGVDGQVEVLLDDLQFANGVVLAPDESHVLVAETGAYRVTRRWLSGPRAGSTDRVVENLPGFPDNMSVGSDGLVWIGMAAPRNALLDRLAPRPPWMRRLIHALPHALTPKPPDQAWALAIDFDGEVRVDLQTDAPGYRMVTAVAEHDGVLALGGVEETAIGIVDLRGVGD